MLPRLLAYSSHKESVAILPCFHGMNLPFYFLAAFKILSLSLVLSYLIKIHFGVNNFFVVCFFGYFLFFSYFLHSDFLMLGSVRLWFSSCIENVWP